MLDAMSNRGVSDSTAMPLPGAQACMESKTCVSTAERTEEPERTGYGGSNCRERMM